MELYKSPTFYFANSVVTHVSGRFVKSSSHICWKKNQIFLISYIISNNTTIKKKKYYRKNILISTKINETVVPNKILYLLLHN